MTAKLCFTYVTPTVNEVVSLPAFKYAGAAGTTELHIDWGDGSAAETKTVNTTATPHAHTYTNAGTYVAKIYITASNSATQIQTGYSSTGRFSKLTSITTENDTSNTWGLYNFTSAIFFLGTVSSTNYPMILTSVPDYIPSTVTDMGSMFHRAFIFNGDISGWDVSNVTNMYRMFHSAYKFNADISSWDVSNVIYMSQMFTAATAFNADISSWDVSAVTDMSYMFVNATAFNREIFAWTLSTNPAPNLTLMFDGATTFQAKYGVGSTPLVSDFGQPARLCFTYIVTSNVSVSLPAFKYAGVAGTTILYIDWGDGSAAETKTVTTTQTPHTHTYSAAGTYVAKIYITASNPATEIQTGYNISVALSKLTSITTEYDLNNTWGLGNFTKAEHFFRMASTLTSVPDYIPSTVTSMKSMFSLTGSTTNSVFNGDISGWDVSNVTNMNSVFVYATSFNRDIGGWDVSSVTDMGFMFSGASSFNGDISGWDVSSVTNMEVMFSNATAFDRGIFAWTLSTNPAPTLTNMFNGATTFQAKYGVSSTPVASDFGKPAQLFFTYVTPTVNELVSLPAFKYAGVAGTTILYIDWGDGSAAQIETLTTTQTSHAHTYSTAGTYVAKFYITATDPATEIQTDHNFASNALTKLTSITTEYDLNNTWGLGNITSMRYFFAETSTLTSVPDYIPSTVTDTRFMFHKASVFNGDISGWDVSNVDDMTSMFREGAFNQDISGWDVSNVTQMTQMFYNATAFNQEILAWTLKDNNVNLSSMFLGANAFKTKYGVADTPLYTDFQQPAQLIMTFITTANSTNVYMPGIATATGDLSITINWGDSNDTSDDGTSTINNTNALKDHTYATAGTYYATIYLTYVTATDSQFGSGATTMTTLNAIETRYDVNKTWGLGGNVTSLAYLCFDATKLTSIPDYIPSTVTNMSSMFRGLNGSSSNYTMNVDIDSWDVSNVTNMSQMFYQQPKFNRDLNSWDVSSVTNMSSMFNGGQMSTTDFNGDISAWNVTNVTNMSNMFDSATSFNGNLSAWRMVSVTNTTYMFNGASSFVGGNLNSWFMPSLTNMSHMFYNTVAFNGDIGDWDVSAVTNMSSMFEDADVFNGDIGGWNTSSVTNMELMFNNATSFNGDINAWDVTNVFNMSNMFNNATAFDQPIFNWTLNGTTTTSMFFGATAFISKYGSIPNWNTTPPLSLFGQPYNVYVQGKFISGNDLTADENISDKNGGIISNITYQWTRDYVVIGGETNVTYTLLSTDDLMYIGITTSFDVTYPGGSAISMSVSKYLTINYDNTENNPPRFNVKNLETVAWEPFSTTISVTNSNSEIINKFALGSITPAAAWLTTITNNQDNTCTLSGTPSNIYDTETYTVVIEADDRYTTTSREFTLVVNPATLTFKFDYPQVSNLVMYLPIVWNAAGEIDVTWDVAGVSSSGKVGPNTYNASSGPATAYISSFDNAAGGTSFALSTTAASTIIEVKLQVKSSTVTKIFTNDGSSSKDYLYNLSSIETNSPSTWGLPGIQQISLNRSGINSLAPRYNFTIPNSLPSTVTSLYSAFQDCGAFNQDISGWDVSAVIVMDSTFRSASAFNQDISGWDVSAVTDMSNMFSNATSFDQPILSTWEPKSLNKDYAIAIFGNGSATAMVARYATSTSPDYDPCIEKLILGTAGTENPVNLFFKNGITLTYITTGSNESITLPINTNAINNGQLQYCVDWGDNDPVSYFINNSGTVPTHTYVAAGTYTARIVIQMASSISSYNSLVAAGNNSIGSFSAGSNVTLTGADKLVAFDIASGADYYPITSFGGTFTGCTSLVTTSSTIPSSVTNLTQMFKGATAIKDLAILGWDTSNVTTYTDMFDGATLMNSNYGASATPTSAFFNKSTLTYTYVFPTTGTYTVGSVGSGTIVPSNCYAYASYDNGSQGPAVKPANYNAYITVTTTRANESIKYTLCNWDTSTASFIDAHYFSTNKVYVTEISTNNPSNWGFSRYTQLTGLFRGMTALTKVPNQLPSWLTSLLNMFRDATAFNQDISGWDVSNVTNMSLMFRDATAFNQPIGKWDVSKVTSFSATFHNASAFNQDISGWDVSKVTSFSETFHNASVFNQPIGKWDVSSGTSFAYFFRDATAFNRNIFYWDTENSTTYNQIFTSATAMITRFSGTPNWSTSPSTSQGNLLFNKEFTISGVSLTGSLGSAYSSPVIVTDIADSDNTTIALTANMPSWLSFNSTNGILSGTPTVAGSYEVSITATGDAAGSTTETYTIVVTENAPVFTSSTTTTVNEDATTVFTITSDKTDAIALTSVTQNASPISTPSWLALNDTTVSPAGSATLTSTNPANADVGVYIVRVTATRAGEPSIDQDITLTVVNTNDDPTFTTQNINDATEDVAYSQTVIVEDVDPGSTITLSASTKPTWMTFTDNGNKTCTLGGTPVNADVTTSVDVTIEASDGIGTPVSITYTIAVINTPDAPTFLTTSIANATEDYAYNQTVTVEDVDAGSTVTLSASAKPTWMTFTNNGNKTCTLGGTPLNADVTTSVDVTIEADDGIGTPVSITYTIAVTNTNDDPTFTTQTLPDATEDYVYNATVYVADVDTVDTVTLSASTKPTWMTFTNNGNKTCTLGGTPLNADVTTSVDVTIEADDGIGTPVSITYTIAVTNTNDDPTFTTQNINDATEDVAYSQTVIVEDVDPGSTITLSASTKPTWMTFTDNGNKTCTLGGTPVNADVTTSVDVTIEASDGIGTPVSITYTIAVINTPDAPTFLTTSIANATEDYAYNQTVTVEDVDAGSTVTLSASTKPTWMTFTNNGNKTCTLGGTPEQADVGIGITVTIQADDGTTTPVDKTYTINVTETPDGPTFTTTSINDATEDSAYSQTVTVADEDPGSSINTMELISNPPNWITLNHTSGAFTCTLTGTPLHADVGSTVQISIQATDNQDNQTSHTYTINVLNVDNDLSGAVTISNASGVMSGSNVPRRGQALTVASNLTDPDGATVGSPIYTWYRTDAPTTISRGVGSSLLLDNDDVGKYFYVTAMVYVDYPASPTGPRYVTKSSDSTEIVELPYTVTTKTQGELDANLPTAVGGKVYVEDGNLVQTVDTQDGMTAGEKRAIVTANVQGLFTKYGSGTPMYVDLDMINGSMPLPRNVMSNTQRFSLHQYTTSGSLDLSSTDLETDGFYIDSDINATVTITLDSNGNIMVYTKTAADSYTAQFNGGTVANLTTGDIIKMPGTNNTFTAGSLTGENFDSNPCFREDSKILCFSQNKQMYKLVQDLRKGDLVVTAKHGLVPIYKIGTSEFFNPGTDERTANRLYKCSPAKYPSLFEDLYITGCHSILVDSITNIQREFTEAIFGKIFLTDNKFRLIACLDEKAEPYNKHENTRIYHIALEHANDFMNYGIYANGLLVESCSKRYLSELSNMTIVGEENCVEKDALLGDKDTKQGVLC